MIALIVPFILLIALGLLTALLRSLKLKAPSVSSNLRRLLKAKLDPRDFRVLNDVTLTTPRGTTQIDHVVLSRYGIFTLETKHLSGWLFGKAADATWTQSFKRGRVKVRNPILQNAAHVAALQTVTGLPRDKFVPAVIMTGEVIAKGNIGFRGSL